MKRSVKKVLLKTIFEIICWSFVFTCIWNTFDDLFGILKHGKVVIFEPNPLILWSEIIVIVGGATLFATYKCIDFCKKSCERLLACRKST
ncbi:MAG: hypothetical protein B6U95_09120 [Thermofilum sp. ex4484_82]|nr:MAG: hypothetical protein B6U95_09120 [Thermofilum sp. ex4484_82]OYT36009.1 MAG: hypothetical protein B6U96_09130 [Archaeoglobales archaeon ex4484_92]